MICYVLCELKGSRNWRRGRMENIFFFPWVTLTRYIPNSSLATINSYECSLAGKGARPLMLIGAFGCSRVG
jgi:hypothetical protein